jgi:hypothetical protein
MDPRTTQPPTTSARPTAYPEPQGIETAAEKNTLHRSPVTGRRPIIMKHLKLTELLKSDAGLLFLDRVGALDIPGNWYINAPLGVWALVGLPVTISLAERLVTLANHKPGRIVGFSELDPAI